MTHEKLPFWRRLGYGMGDIYGGGASILISFYYLIFLVDVVRISPGLAGLVIFISKAYDSITDPFEGVISDRTRTRLGRRRPYLVAGIILIFLSFLALFYPVGFDNETTRFVYVVVAYLFYSTVNSIVSLNYNALQSELSLDYDERSALSSFRIFFSTVSSILAALLPLQIVAAFPDERQGWTMMALFFGMFFAVPFVFTVVATREREDFQADPRPFNWREVFIEPFKIRSFVHVLGMYLFAFIAVDAVGNVVVFYMKSYMGRGDEASFVSGTLLVAQVISLPFYLWLSRRTSKRHAFITGAVIWMVMMTISLFITPDMPTYTIYVFAVLTGFGTGGVVVMVYAMFPDIPDVDELQSRERREGIYSAMFTFSRKLSSAFAIFLVAQAIEVAGYTPPLEIVVEGPVRVLEMGGYTTSLDDSFVAVTRFVDQQQSDGFITTLRVVFAVVPIASLMIALWFAFRYPLSQTVHRRLRQILSARRQGHSTDSTEAADLGRLLIGSRSQVN